MSLLVLLISGGIRIYSYALIIYILMSWLPGARESQFGEFLGVFVNLIWNNLDVLFHQLA